MNEKWVPEFQKPLQLDIIYLTSYFLISLGVNISVMDVLWNTFPSNFRKLLLHRQYSNDFSRKLRIFSTALLNSGIIVQIETISAQFERRISVGDINPGPSFRTNEHHEAFYSGPKSDIKIYRFHTKFDRLKFDIRVTFDFSSTGLIEFMNFDDEGYRIYNLEEKWILVADKNFIEIPNSKIVNVCQLFIQAYVQGYPYNLLIHSKIKECLDNL